MTTSQAGAQLLKAGAPSAEWSQRLLIWYATHRRDLPWRSTRDPYAIWVSEIMLQQTQVETVIPYYHRFLRRFPSVTRLANARLDSVLKLWQGLGYYRRARNLHRAARDVERCHPKGRLPDTFADLRRLPGLGDYTAAAIASIAFGEPVPAIDGNVLRIMARFLTITEPLQSSALRGHVRGILTCILPHVPPSDFNQALMDLGALVCRPTRPACGDCPLASDCLAYRTGQTDYLPIRVQKRTLPHHRVVVGIIRRDDHRFLIARRPADGMFGGMWELPGGKVIRGERLDAALHREINEELGVEIEVTGRHPVVRQTYSHFRVSITPFEARIIRGTPQALAATALRWITASAAGRYALPLATQRILNAWTKP